MLHETIFNVTLLATFEAPASCPCSCSTNPGRQIWRTLLTWLSTWLISVLRGAFRDGVALKVNDGGVASTNPNKIQATILQVFESDSKTCNMLPQQNVALKIALCAMLHETTFNPTILSSKSTCVTLPYGFWKGWRALEIRFTRNPWPTIPILVLCYDIFTDRCIFRLPFPKKTKAVPVRWPYDVRLISCNWSPGSYGSLIGGKFNLKINW